MGTLGSVFTSDIDCCWCYPRMHCEVLEDIHRQRGKQVDRKMERQYKISKKRGRWQRDRQLGR